MLVSVDAAAQCTVTTDGTGTGLIFETCTESSSNGSQSIDIALPAGTVDGNLLIASVATDGTPTVTAPTDWTQIDIVAAGNNAAQLAVFYKIASSETGPYTFTTDVTEAEVVTMMRFSGANGTILSASSSGTTGTPVAPSVTTTSTDNLILRLAVWDDDDVTDDPATIVAGHSNINQDSSGNGGGTTTGAAAYVKQSGIGASNTADFESASEEWATMTLALEPGVINLSPDCTVPTDGSGSFVVFESCTEAKVVGATSVSPSLPTSPALSNGDLLVAVVAVDGNEAISESTGDWTEVSDTVSNSAVTMAVYTRVVDGTEAASYTFSWSGSEDAVSFILHFSGTSGDSQPYVASSVSTGTTGTPQAPSVDTSSNDVNTENNLILRIGAWDGIGQGYDPGVIISAHSNINQDYSTGAIGAVTGAAAYEQQPGAGASGTADFLSGTEEWITQSLAIEPPAAPGPDPICPGLNGTVVGNQLVVIEDCSEAKVASNSTTVTISTPTTTAQGDLLLLVVNSDDNETLTDLSAAWTLIDAGDAGGAGPTLGVYYKFALSGDAGGLGAYTFQTGTAEEHYAYMLRLTGASGLILNAAAATGSGTTPTAPTLTSLADNSLIVRIMAADDDDITIDPATVVSGQRNITQDASGSGAGTVSGAAVYVSQDTAGPNPTVDFALNASESWRAITLAVEPLEFRFALGSDGFDRLSLCSLEEITISVVNRVGNPVTNFSGTVSLSTSSGTGNWTDPGNGAGQPQGTLTDSVAGDGNATYTFVSADNGEVTLQFTTDTVGTGTINFNLSYTLGSRTFTEDTDPLNPYDPDLAVDSNCEFRLSLDGGVAAANGGTCAIEPLTVSLFDSDGVLAQGYTGTVDLTMDTGTTGNFSIVSGSGTLTPDPDNDNNGAASYTFDAADGGQVVIGYSNLTAGTYNFDATDATGGYTTSATAINDPDLTLADCEVRITIADSANESDVCSLADITFTVADASGNTITDFTGLISISTDTGTGDWSGGGTNSVTNGIAGDGDATYNFASADNGAVTLNFFNPFTTPVGTPLGFSASGTAPNGASLVTSGTVNEELTVLGCTVDIQVTDGLAELCEAGEVVTYTLKDRDGATATDFVGSLILTTSTGNGDYVDNGANGTFDNGTSDDGTATYAFSSADNGVLSVTFSNSVAETLTMEATGSGITLDGASVDEITFSACEFRIAYTDSDPGDSDVCSIESVQIGVYSSTGSLVTTYTGIVNLSTTTGNGTWADPGGTALGTLTDPVAEDGSATYEFVSGDNGQVTLNFTDATNETTNINVSDGVTTDPANNTDPNDPDLTVGLCTFQISFDGGASANDAAVSACEVQAVTITVRDRLGNISTDYTGTMSLTTSTANGNWTDPGNGAGQPQGTLVDVALDDDGAASYQFALGDAGQVTLDYSNLNPETVNINLVDGVIVEEGVNDPDLVIESCRPTVSSPQCSIGASPLSSSLTIGAQETNPALQGRMVLIATTTEGSGDITGVTFNGSALTQIYDERITGGAADMNTELWGILDTNLPAAAGAYTASVTHSNGLETGMCAFFVDDVEQVFPAENLVTPTAGQVNGSSALNPASGTTATTITTTQNNALVVSVISNGETGDYIDVDPALVITRLFNGPDPTDVTFAGSSGTYTAAQSITVVETPSVASPNYWAHVVAAFNPIITGPPLADSYVPVTLFQTYAGPLSYRAIGNTFRTAANPTSCSFAATSSATLTLPDEPIPAGFDSTVEAAYLYWFASGDDALGQVDADVTFTDPSLTATNLTADDVFLIDNVGQAGTLDFFAGYKDITALVTGNGTYTLSNLTMQSGPPWSDTQACAGGWAMVVVYSNDFEQLRVLNLFHGFQPFQNSSFTLVPRNFRMAVPNDAEDLPNGQVTHISVEGDETLFDGDETLQIQDTPGATSYTSLDNYYNPLQAEFGGTVTYPLYSLVDVDPGPDVEQYYLFDSGLGAGGYDILFPGVDVGDEVVGAPDPVAGDEIGASWGVDVDTHYISGDGNTADGDDDVLFAFAQAEAEELVTRYSAGQDLVLLVSEIISVTSGPLADIEVTKSTSDTFTVGGSASYTFEVKNNGNNMPSFGSATGEITLSDTLPAGLTFAAAGDVSGDGWVCSVTLDPGAFTCTFDIATDWTLARGAAVAGELGETSPGSGVGEALPTLTATVQIGDTSFFPLLDNSVTNVVRAISTGGSCTVFPPGQSPNFTDCTKSPEYDNVADLQGGVIDINTLSAKSNINNNVDALVTNIRGVETDLSINKFVNGVLEEGSGAGAGQYTIRVTNLGPDATTEPFVISDSDPAFVTFVSVVPDPDWNCTSITPTLSCSYIGPSLAVGASKDLLLNVTVDGVAGDVVTNTAGVSTGPFNFDTDSSNDADTDITTIVAAPVAGVEKFLLSVSTALGDNGPTDLATLSAFDDQDLVLYDPVLDEATLFFDHSGASGASVDDINAVHVLPNGMIVLSANASSTLGGVAFEADDLVRYDPLNNTATLIFDGSTVFASAGENIDAVYVKDNSNLIFSTTGSASIGGLSFDKSDLIEYDITALTATILVDGSDADVFNAADLTQLDAAYVRVDPADATAVIDAYALSTDDATATLQASSTAFTRDDVVELDRTVPSSQSLFRGNVPLGVFTDNDTGTTDPELRLDALHVVETGYLGHFAITQSQAGTTCAAGKVTITKHQGLTHSVDTDYFGSVLLSTSTNTGTWGLDTGSGILIDAVPGDGLAVYTFVPGDNGDVTLSLSISTATSGINVDVTNGFVTELASEDPDFDFNNVVTVVTYRDEFSLNSFSNNDGSTAFAGSWQEIDDADGVSGANSGLGVSTGNIQVSGGELSMTSNTSTAASGRDPSVQRDVDFSTFTATETIFLNFDYRYAALNSSDSIVVEVSDDSGANWTAFPAYTGLSGSAGPIAASLNVSTLGGTVDDFSGTLSVRFRINSGYTLASTFYFDDVELRTGTTDCGVGVIDHYAISHSGNGIQCLGSDITIVGHDASHFPSAPGNGEAMTLTTSTGKGTWASIISGFGTLSDVGAQGAATNTDGTGIYTWFGSEDTVVLRFNYTDPTLDPEPVNFNLSGLYSEDTVTANHDDDLLVSRAGLRFFNETDQLSGIPTQISGKPSNIGYGARSLILQALQTSNEDVGVCEPLFTDTTTVTVEFSAECDDPASCSGSLPAPSFTVNGTSVALADQNGVSGAALYTEVDVTFESQTTSTGAPLVVSYSDAGQIELHARYDIPFDNDVNSAITSEDYLVGNDSFVVRPFGFDIDFDEDRANNGGGLSRANDATGPAFARAGVDFSTSVTARVWQAADDSDSDGVPDSDANLTDNDITPNYGNESSAPENDVVVTHSLVEPAVAIGSRDGTLTGGSSFTGFTAGASTANLQFSEVGIITLNANLADNNYLGSGEDVQGNTVNVGRFYPHNFNLTSASTTATYTTKSPFTYMGQEFTTSFTLQARNADNEITQNYIGDFVKLAATAFDVDSVFQAVDDIDSADDLDYSPRLTSVDGSFNLNWDDFGDPGPGTSTVSGRLIFNRENDGIGVDGAEDGPFVVAIGTNVQDTDAVAITLTGADINDDADATDTPDTPLYRRLTATDIEFRYGRLLIDNAYGPETEDLDVPLRIEYWNGTEFITNIDDDATAFFFDISASPAALDFVDSSYQSDPGTADPLAPGDISIEPDALVDVTVNLFNGVLAREQDGDSDDTNDPDRPFTVSAPDPLAINGTDGRVMIEFDLDSPTLPFSLEFLGYDWRGGGGVDDYDEIPDGAIYTDNPRGILEFGSFRGHDRVFNWQEIYNSPSQ